MNRLAATTTALVLAGTLSARADQTAQTIDTPYTLRPSVMMGLNQWVLFGGGNVAAQVKVRRWVIEYSHGQSLHFDRLASVTQTAAERAAGVSVEMPWTTGGGFGLQITPRLHVLIEAKAHRYLVRGVSGDRLEYTSFTLGPGVFYDIYLWRNLFIQPSLRWWPTIASTYETSELMRSDGTSYTHRRHDLLPFANISVGWTFDGS